MKRRVPVLYLDLDGTVRHGKDEIGSFVNSPDDVQIFDGVVDLMRQYRDLGWRIVGVSNQGGIALGYMTEAQCMETINATQIQCDRLFDHVAFCPHHPDSDDLEMAVCWCRKPRPGMIIESAYWLCLNHPDEDYPPYMALMVGDRLEDQLCAGNAGVSFMSAQDWREGKHLAELR